MMIQKKSLNKPVMVLTQDELREYNFALMKLEEAETMVEVNAWKRKIDSIIENARPHQGKRKKGNLVFQKPVVYLSHEEKGEYSKALQNLEAAESMMEVNAWHRKIKSILQKAKNREYREIRRKAALYDALQAKKEQSVAFSI